MERDSAGTQGSRVSDDDKTGRRLKASPLIEDRGSDKQTMIERENVEIRNQAHLMDAEGAHTHEVDYSEIEQFLAKEGYFATNIDIFFDSAQGLTRWTCDIIKLQ